MDLRLLGSTLLIIGTSIGAGLLALPIVTAQTGFFYACILLFACWFVMTVGALLLLEVNLRLPLDSNIISIARQTLGRYGQLITWFVYLFLLYALLSAYISGGSEVTQGLLATANIQGPRWFSTLVFILILGSIVYFGIRCVDWTNRTLMIIKLISFILLVGLAMPHIHLHYLAHHNITSSFSAIMVVLTSFGYAIVIPSLRVYLRSDVKKLKLAIFFGSTIPLACYLLWIFVVQGVIPLQGTNSLTHIAQSNAPVAQLTKGLNYVLNNSFVTTITRIFTSICVITSFLGVALSLSDFLSDGFQIAKKGNGNFIIYGATFLPPLLIVLFFPGIFIKALSYAGILCVILLVLLPALMAWRIRKKLTGAVAFRVRGGQRLLVLIIVAAILLLVLGFYQSILLS